MRATAWFRDCPVVARMERSEIRGRRFVKLRRHGPPNRRSRIALRSIRATPLAVARAGATCNSR
jgi:hypothetical protein